MSTLMQPSLDWLTAVNWLAGVQIKAAVLLAIAFAVAWLVRGRSAATRRRVWASALAAALLLPIASSLVPTVAVDSLPATGALVGPATQAPEASAPQASHDAVDLAVATESEGPALGSISIAMLWGLGCLLLLGRHTIALHRAQRLVRSSRALPGPARRLADPTKAELRIAPEIESPIAIGTFRATILVPESFDSWAPALQRSAVLHELAHVERKDCLFLTVGAIVRGLFWINPLAWMALARLRLEAERAADDAVLEGGIKPSDYATQLLDLAGLQPTRPAIAAASFPIVGGSLLGRRVRAILDAHGVRSTRHARLAVPVALGTIGAALTCAVIEGERPGDLELAVPMTLPEVEAGVETDPVPISRTVWLGPDALAMSEPGAQAQPVLELEDGRFPDAAVDNHLVNPLFELVAEAKAERVTLFIDAEVRWPTVVDVMYTLGRSGTSEYVFGLAQDDAQRGLTISPPKFTMDAECPDVGLPLRYDWRLTWLSDGIHQSVSARRAQAGRDGELFAMTDGCEPDPKAEQGSGPLVLDDGTCEIEDDPLPALRSLSSRLCDVNDAPFNVMFAPRPETTYGEVVRVMAASRPRGQCAGALVVTSGASNPAPSCDGGVALFAMP